MMIQEFWHLKTYTYVFYRFVVETLLFRKHLPRLLLDAGCGPSGSLLNVPSSVNVVGVNVDRRNILKAHQRGTEDSFVVASLTDLPFKSGIFDSIVCVDVLEHIDAKEKAINEISRISQTNGSFVGSTSNLLNPVLLFDCWAPKLAELLSRKFSGENYERRNRFTPATLAKALKRVGFQVNIVLLGFPPFQPWLYEFSDRKLPWFAYLWIAFDKLTNRNGLKILKETVVFEAVKKEWILHLRLVTLIRIVCALITKCARICLGVCRKNESEPDLQCAPQSQWLS
jgi:SAM-dependent methyltransferase